MDALALAQALIRCPSVTPRDEGALDLLEKQLGALGFRCQRLTFQAPGTVGIDNLFASIGQGKPHFLFAGHSDVVPVGDKAGWSLDPFGGLIDQGRLFGRGAADMKGAIAAFVGAAHAFISQGEFKGTLSLLITGDEEGPAVNGTKPAMEKLKYQGEEFDVCLVGEPTNPTKLGEMIKIGRRGSMTGKLKVQGIQGHSAYPHLARNAAHDMVKAANALLHPDLDSGTNHFQPSNLQIVSIDIGNEANNILPGSAHALFNIRFNDLFTASSLEEEIRRRLSESGIEYELSIECSGEAFLTRPGPFTDLVKEAVTKITELQPELSTSGGTSDARFIKNYCPVVEFGLVGKTMHKTDEHILLKDFESLLAIYHCVLVDFFRP